MTVRPTSRTKRAVIVAALCPFVLAGCGYPRLNTAPPSASMANPWGALSIFRAGDKLRVYLDEGVVGETFLQLRGRFVSATDVSITITMNVDQFSRPPQAGAGSLFVLEQALSYWSDPTRTSSRRRHEIEFAVEEVAAQGDEVEMTLRKQSVLAVSKPNVWRWAGPQRE